MFLQDRAILDKTFENASEEERLGLVHVLLDAFAIQNDTALALASENKDLSAQNSDIARKLNTARNSMEATITNLMKLWSLYLGMNEVFDKAIDLLKQDSSNSNWSSSSNRIKPFGKAANSYQNQMQSKKKQVRDKFDNIDVALSWFYGSPQLFKRIEEAAQKSNDKQAALEAQKRLEGVEAMVAAMNAQAQASSDAAAGDKECSSDDKPSGDRASGDNSAPETTSGDNTAPETVPEGGDTKAAETASAGSGEADSTAGAEDSVDDEDSMDEDKSDGEESSDHEKPSGGVSDASKGPDAAGKDEGKRKPGGRKGHRGCNKVVTEKPDKVVVSLGDHCPECPHYAECCDRAIKKGKCTVQDVEFKLVNTAYYKGTIWCKEHGCYVHGQHPENVRGRFQYGVVLQALIVCLYAIGYVSIERIHDLLKDVMGVSMSTGTIMNIIKRAGVKGVAYWDFIRCMVRSAKVAGSDETSAFVKGDGGLKRYWIHTVVSKLFTYLYCSPFRGYQAIIEDGILVDFLGVLVHDCCYQNKRKIQTKCQKWTICKDFWTIWFGFFYPFGKMIKEVNKMGWENLQSRHQELLDHMEKQAYSSQYISSVRKQIDLILDNGSKPGWRNYNEISNSYSSLYSEGSLKYNMAVLGIIEQFDTKGVLPSRHQRNRLFYEHRESKLKPDFIILINLYREAAKKTNVKNSTIEGAVSEAVSFFLFVQSRGEASIDEITEDTVLRYFGAGETMPAKSTSRKRLRWVINCGLTWKAAQCKQLLSFLPLLRVSRKNIEYLTKDEVLKIKCILNSGEVSRRDRAVMLLLLETGLRASDIASMTFDSLDWEYSKICIVQSKTSLPLEIPLSVKLGNAILEYLTEERKECNEDHLFLTERKPYLAMHPASIGNIVNKTFKLAGIRSDSKSRKGTHIFRHHVATTLLGNGVQMPIISEVLGHNSPASLKYYLSADFTHLKECSLSVEKFPIKPGVLSI